MKNKLFYSLFFLIVASILTPVTLVAAVSPTPESPSEAVTEKLSNQIKDLKEKVASRVAQLKLVEKRGIIGTVKDVDNTKLTLTDIQGNQRDVDVDEITKFSSPSAKASFGISDITPGSKLSIIGLYNKDSERILARFVTTITYPIMVSGAVSAIDTDNYTITLATEDGTPTLVDIDTITKTSSYDGDTVERSGFSKIEKGTRAIVIGYPDIKQKNRVVALRILLFPTLPKNPKVVVPQNAVDTSEGITPSTGSGKKLTPVK